MFRRHGKLSCALSAALWTKVSSPRSVACLNLKKCPLQVLSAQGLGPYSQIIVSRIGSRKGYRKRGVRAD